jgi:hypothetical protein
MDGGFPMLPRLSLALLPLAFLLVTAVPVTAHPGHEYFHFFMGPSGVILGVSGGGCDQVCRGFAVCTNFDFILPLRCFDEGYGARIDVSDLDPTLDFAYGTCEVEGYLTALPDNTNFICGTDRDDDGFVTNFDAGCMTAPFSCSTDPDGHDDDLGCGETRLPMLVCLRRDNAVGGGDWDDVLVFTVSNIRDGFPTMDPGMYEVTLSLTDATSCRVDELVSSHTHATYFA